MNGNGMEKPEKEEVAMVPKAGWGEKSGSWDKDEGDAGEEGCGVGSCRPGFLKRFSHVMFFSIVMGLAHMYVNTLTGYFRTQFMWLERLYNLTPAQTSMLLVWGKIGFLVLVPFLSVFARRWHMPRTLSITTFVVALAAVLIVLPYGIHKPDLYAPPNVTEATQFTMKNLQKLAPTCTSDPEMAAKLAPLMSAVYDKDCNIIPPGQQQQQQQSPQKPAETKPAGGSEKTDSSDPDSSPVTNGNNTDSVPKDPASPGSDAADPQSSDPDDAGAADAKPAEPEAPRPTIMVPDFTKISKHPVYPSLKNMALSTFNLDLDAIAAMSREEQVQALANMPPEMQKNLPLLKGMLGDNADSYFFPVTVPESAADAAATRRRRQAETEADGEEDPVPPSAGDDVKNSTDAAAVAAPPPESTVVQEKKPEEKEMSEEEKKKDEKDKMLKKLETDMNWSGQMAFMARTIMAEAFANPCLEVSIKKFVASQCPYTIGPLLEDRDNAATVFVALVSLGMVLAGLAAAAHPAFSAIYVDTRSTETRAGLCFGIMFGLSALGALEAQLLGVYATTSYLTLEDVGLMGFLNPRWVGAWWTGVVAVVICCAVVSILLFFFPNPSDRLTKQAKEKALSKTAKGFLQSGMRLLGNPIFLLITFANALTVMACEGMLQNLPSYVEKEFSFLGPQMGMFLGIVIALFMAIGVFGGGLISSLAKLSPFNCLKLVTGCALVVFVLQASLLGIGCDQPKINMGDDKMVNLTTGGQLQCGDTCVCMDFLYMPACGSDGNTYFSPCHAGCGFPIDEGDSFAWHHCKCIDDDVQTAKPGICEQDCHGGAFIGFCIVSVLVCFLIAIKVVPAFLAMYRSVEKQDAPVAIGVNAFLVTLIGAIPSPMIYETVFNGICLLERDPCGPISNCAIYDVDALRMNFHGLSAGLKAAAALLYVIAVVLGFREGSVYSRAVHENDGRR